METDSSEAETVLNSFVARFRANHACPVCKKILNDPVGSNDCDHLFCRGCWEQLVSGKGQCPKCESIIVDTSLKDVTDKVLSVSNTVNNFIRDFSRESSLDFGNYLGSCKKTKPPSNPAVSPKPEVKVTKWLSNQINAVDKSTASSPASGATNISSLGSATSWSSHMQSFTKMVADDEEQPQIQTAPSPPPKPNSHPQIKTYTKAKRGRGGGGSQRGARRGRANPRKSALPITSSSSTPPTGRRSLPLSTPSPTEWQLQLERSQPSIPSGKEVDVTPPKTAMAVDEEPMRPFTPAACEHMSIFGEPVQQSTPQLLAPRMKISFIKKGNTAPKKPIIVRRRMDEPVATFTLLGPLERLPSPKPKEDVISMAIQTEKAVLVSTATQSEETVTTTQSVEVQTDLELIFSPKATAKAQESMETVSQPSTFVMEKETTDAVAFSDSDDSLREAFKSADQFYKRSRRLSDSSGDVPSSKRSRSSPPPPAVESLEQFYSPLKTDQVVDEDSIPSAQKTVVAESDQEDEFMSATPPGTQRKVLCYSGLTREPAKMVESWVNRVDADLVKVFSDKVTHLIVQSDEEKRTQRTLKFLYAVASRKWIVSVGWVQQCIKEGRFVDEEPFEVLDMEGGDGPHRARICSPYVKLFQAFEFCCVEPFSEVTTTELRDLLERCGAAMVLNPSEMMKTRRHSIAIVQLNEDEGAEVQQRQAGLWLDQHGVLTVSREWILDCIASHRLLPILNHLIGKHITVSMLRMMKFDELLLAD